MGRARVVDVAPDVFLDKRYELAMQDGLRQKVSEFMLTVRQNLALSVSQEFRMPSQVARMFGCLNCEWRGSGLCQYAGRKGVGQKVSSFIKQNKIVRGICDERLRWLAGFYRGSKSSPTYTEFIMDYNQGLAQAVLDDDFRKLKGVEARVGGVDKRLAALRLSIEQEEEIKRRRENGGDGSSFSSVSRRDAKHPGDDSGSVSDLSDLGSEFRGVSIKLTGKLARKAIVEYRALNQLRSQYRFEWFMLWRELMTADQRRLDRDMPKKVEMTHKSITPSDVGRLIREARVIEAEAKDV